MTAREERRQIQKALAAPPTPPNFDAQNRAIRLIFVRGCMWAAICEIMADGIKVWATELVDIDEDTKAKEGSSE